MEKKPRRKKGLNISLDTKNVDIEFSKTPEGEVKLTVDTPKVDVNFTKDVEGNADLDVIIDSKEYEFESNGTSPHLPKGKIWKITGELLRIFIAKKLGKRLK